MRLARTFATTIALLVAPSLTYAQDSRGDSDAEWLERCRQDGMNGRNERAHACEVRDVPVKLRGRTITIDGRRNGGIRVFGEGNEAVRVTARVQAEGRTDAEAREMLSRIRISADDRTVRADGPDTDGDDDRGWWVGYVVNVPRTFDLDLEAHNGGVGVSGVSGKLDLRTWNGSLSLSDVGGDVTARTQNGSLNVQLTGSRWIGTGLDAETHNGSVRLSVPEQYSASLEVGTVNGAIRTDIPITVSGRISHELNIPLGGGGKPIRVHTTNGSVTITRR
jgi:hypothetical protein